MTTISPLIVISPIALIASCSTQAATPSGFEAQRIKEGLSFQSGSTYVSKKQLEQMKANNNLAFDYLKGFNWSDFKYQINKITTDRDGIWPLRKDYLKLDLKIINRADQNDVTTVQAKVAYEEQTFAPEVEVLIDQLDQIKPTLKFSNLDQVNRKAINNWLGNTNKGSDNIEQSHQQLLTNLFTNDKFPTPGTNVGYIINDLAIIDDKLEIQFQAFLRPTDSDQNQHPLFSQTKRFDLSFNETVNNDWQALIANQIIKNKWLELIEETYERPLNQQTILNFTNWEDLANQFLAISDLNAYQVDEFEQSTIFDPDTKLNNYTATFKIKTEQWTSDPITLTYSSSK